MRKKHEIHRPKTCLNNAHDEEMVFVLLGRDAAAPVAIRAWVAERLRLGKNIDTDPQIVEALDCANTMQAEGRKWADAMQCEAPIGFAGRCTLKHGHDGPHREFNRRVP